MHVADREAKKFTSDLSDTGPNWLLPRLGRFTGECHPERMAEAKRMHWVLTGVWAVLRSHENVNISAKRGSSSKNKFQIRTI